MNTLKMVIGAAIDGRMNAIHTQLEIEESGRTIASLQGELAGLKFIQDLMYQEYPEIGIGRGEEFDPEDGFDDMDTSRLRLFEAEKALIISDTGYEEIGEKITAEINKLKDFLIYHADKNRQLDIAQGKVKGMKIVSRVFEQLDYQLEKRKEELPFDDDEDDSFTYIGVTGEDEPSQLRI